MPSLPLVLVLAAAVLAGCAAGPTGAVKRTPVTRPGPEAVPTSGPTGGEDPFAGFPARLRMLARESQRRGEFQKAILLWNAVKGFLPDDPEAAEAVSSLQGKARRNAESHFRKGIEFQRQGDIDAAQREFLLALAHDPELEGVLPRLRETAGPPDVVVYDTRGGDTPRSIAEKVYGDPERAIVVSHFAKVAGGENGILEEGMRLILPAPDPMTKANGETSRSLLEKVRNLLRERNYREAVRQAEKILAADPGNRYAGEALDAAYYQLGMSLFRDGRSRESLRYLERVDPGYRNAGEVIASLKERIEEADALYAKGLRHFLAEELDAAETEWEKTLELDPFHPKAGRDLEKVRRMKGALKRMQ